MEPKFSVGVPMFFGSFLPRILNKVSAPLTEPFKATYAFDIFRTKIEDALLLTEEAQLKHIASEMIKYHSSNT